MCSRKLKLGHSGELRRALGSGHTRREINRLTVQETASNNVPRRLLGEFPKKGKRKSETPSLEKRGRAGRRLNQSKLASCAPLEKAPQVQKAAATNLRMTDEENG